MSVSKETMDAALNKLNDAHQKQILELKTEFAKYVTDELQKQKDEIYKAQEEKDAKSAAKAQQDKDSKDKEEQDKKEKDKKIQI